MPAWFNTAVTIGVLEYSRPEKLVLTDYFANHGFAWVAAAEYGAVHATTENLKLLGYATAFHPTALLTAFAALRCNIREDNLGECTPVAAPVVLLAS